MGLAGRKIKQRIPNDPRNLAWSENAAKFGHTYLAKLGWTPSTGLGVAGDGRTTNIAVAQKLDQLGIGAGRGGAGAEKDSIAWKQQNEFEAVLARLNSGDGSAKPPKTGVAAALGFVAHGVVETPVPSVGAFGDTPVDDPVEYKKQEKKKRKLSDVDGEDNAISKPKSDTSTIEPPPRRRFAHHRARLLNSKRIVGKSATEIAEVLGVASSSASTTVSSPTPIDSPSGALTPISDVKIATSSTSVSDYFKEKMAKLRNKHKWMAESSSSSDLVIPSLPSQNDNPDVGERPRTGLGARNALVLPAIPTATSNPSPSSSFPVLSGSLPASEPTSVAQDPPSASPPAKGDEDAKMHDTKVRKKDKKKKPKSGESTVSPVVDGSMNANDVDDDGISKRERRAVKKKRKVETNEATIAIDVDADRERQQENIKGKKRKARHGDNL